MQKHNIMKQDFCYIIVLQYSRLPTGVTERQK